LTGAERDARCRFPRSARLDQRPQHRERRHDRVARRVLVETEDGPEFSPPMSQRFSFSFSST
jgi:hypothetical protein